MVYEKAFIYQNDNTNQPPQEGPVPEEYIQDLINYREEMVGKIAETDDALLVKYLEEKEITQEEIKRALRNATLSYQIVPVLCGSAANSIGIQPLLWAVADYLPSPVDIPPVQGVRPRTGEALERNVSEDEPFSALAFKVVTDPFVGRLVYLRIYSGKAKSGAMVLNSSKGKRERLGRLLEMHAQRREEVDEATYGSIVAAVGLKDTFTGDTLCEESNPIILETIAFPEPVISVAIEPKTKADQEKLADSMRKLADEDPTFQVRYQEETGQTLIAGMGELHLEVLVDRMRREFSVDGMVGKPKVSYREAITAAVRVEGRFVRQTGGHGQYGHVWLEIEPLERGKGFQFENRIVGGAIPREFIPSVGQGIREALENGAVAGYPVVDVKASLVDGTYHDVDSSEIAFKMAGFMATREGLRKAKPILLEPIMELEVVTPGEFLGDVLADLSGRRAKISGIEGRDDIQIVRSLVPLAEAFGYATNLRSRTQGRATHTMEFADYQKVPDSVAAEASKA